MTKKDIETQIRIAKADVAACNRNIARIEDELHQWLSSRMMFNQRIGQLQPELAKQTTLRRLLQLVLYWQWRRTLTTAERLRLDHWGATGNPAHHQFSWAE